MLSTYTINQRLLEAEDSEKKSETTLPLIFQLIFNMLTTLGRTGLPTAILVTDTFNYPVLFAKIAWQGIAVATPVAIFFSLCESKVHDVESKHFERSKKKKGEPKIIEIKNEEKSPQEISSEEKSTAIPIAATEIPVQMQPQPPARSWYQTFLNTRPFEGLSWYQTFVSCGHYLCDVSSGMEFPLLAAKLADGFDDIDPFDRGLIYLGILLFSCAGNWQELLNAITAFREDNDELKNEKEASRSPRP